MLGLFLSGVINWRLIFLIPAALGFILLVFMFVYLPSFRREVGIFEFNYIAAFKNKDVLRIFIYIFLISLIYHAIQQWLGVYFSTQLGFTQFTISMLITLTSLSGVFGEIFGGSLADSLGRHKVVSLGIALMVISIFILTIKLPVFILGIIMIIWGLGWTFNHVGLATMLTDLPKNLINEAASLNSGVRFISGGIGVSISGLIMHKSFFLGFIIFGSALLGLLLLEKTISFKKINGG